MSEERRDKDIPVVGGHRQWSVVAAGVLGVDISHTALGIAQGMGGGCRSHTVLRVVCVFSQCAFVCV